MKNGPCPAASVLLASHTGTSSHAGAVSSLVAESLDESAAVVVVSLDVSDVVWDTSEVDPSVSEVLELLSGSDVVSLAGEAEAEVVSLAALEVTPGPDVAVVEEVIVLVVTVLELDVNVGGAVEEAVEGPLVLAVAGPFSALQDGKTATMPVSALPFKSSRRRSLTALEVVGGKEVRYFIELPNERRMG